jgi:hypothetical protein
VLLEAHVCFGLNFKQEQQLAEPNVLYSELESPMGNGFVLSIRSWKASWLSDDSMPSIFS